MSSLPTTSAADEGVPQKIFAWQEPLGLQGGKQFYSSFTLEGVHYQLGDAVMILSGQNEEPYVGVITAAFCDHEALAVERQCLLQVKWYERVSNLPGVEGQLERERELVELENALDTNSIGCIQQKAYIFSGCSVEEARALAVARGVAGAPWFCCRGVLRRGALEPYSSLQGQAMARDEDVADSEDARVAKRPKVVDGFAAPPALVAVPATAAAQEPEQRHTTSRKSSGRNSNSSTPTAAAAATAALTQSIALALGPQPVVSRTCVECGATQTPQWREGPQGPKTLCNACGVRYGRQQNRAGKRCGGAGVSRAAAHHGRGSGGGSATAQQQQQRAAGTAAAAQQAPTVLAASSQDAAATAVHPNSTSAPGKQGPTATGTGRPIRQAAMLAAKLTAEFARSGSFGGTDDSACTTPSATPTASDAIFTAPAPVPGPPVPPPHPPSTARPLAGSLPGAAVGAGAGTVLAAGPQAAGRGGGGSGNGVTSPRAATHHSRSNTRNSNSSGGGARAGNAAALQQQQQQHQAGRAAAPAGPPKLDRAAAAAVGAPPAQQQKQQASGAPLQNVVAVPPVPPQHAHRLLMSPSHDLSYDSADSAQEGLTSATAVNAAAAGGLLATQYSDHLLPHVAPGGGSGDVGMVDGLLDAAAHCHALTSMRPSPDALPTPCGGLGGAIGSPGGSSHHHLALHHHQQQLQQQQHNQHNQQQQQHPAMHARLSMTLSPQQQQQQQRAVGCVRRQPSDLFSSGVTTAINNADGTCNGGSSVSNGTLGTPTRPGSTNTAHELSSVLNNHPNHPNHHLTLANHHSHPMQHSIAAGGVGGGSGGGAAGGVAVVGAGSAAAGATAAGVSLRAVAARAALWVPGISRFAGVLSYVEEAPREVLPPGLTEVLQGLGWAVDRAADEAAAADAALAAVHQVLLNHQKVAARARTNAVQLISRLRSVMSEVVDRHPQLAVQGALLQGELVQPPSATASLPGGGHTSGGGGGAFDDLDDHMMMMEGCGLLQPCHDPAAALLGAGHHNHHHHNQHHGHHAHVGGEEAAVVVPDDVWGM